MAYDIGDGVRLSVAFTDIAGVAADPTAVQLRVRQPDGTVDTYTFGAAEITKDSTGNYHKDVLPALAGTWAAEYLGTGTVTAMDDVTFKVAAKLIA